MPAALRTLSLPVLACLLTLGLTAFAWQQQHSLAEQELRTRFDAQVSETTLRLQQQIDASAQRLQGVHALYGSHSNISREAFASFLEQQPSLTGLRSIQLAALILPEQRDAFIESQRQAGLRDYIIRAGSGRALYAPVSQIVPAANAGPLDFGRDLLADPEQQRVLTQARDTGEPALSGKLNQGTGGASSFIMATPLYAASKAHSSIDERRSAIIGWAVASFDAAEWLAGAFDDRGPTLSYSLFTGQDDTEDSHLAQSDPGAKSPASKPLFSARQTLRLGDQSWTLQASSPPDFAATYGHDSSTLIALLGSALAVAVLLLCQYLSTRQALASTAAEKAAEALHEAEERWRFALEGSGDGVWDWDLQTGSIHFTPRCDSILGVPTKGAAAALIHPEDEAPEKAAMQACLDGKSSQYNSEHRMQGEDGQWRWIAARGMVLARTTSGAAARMIGTVTDITERKTAADRLSNMAQHDAITGLPNRTLFFDLLQHALFQAKRHKEVLALAYIDLDNFKGINDNFGQSVSNRLLREVGETLGATLRDSDAVAHFGGDDFAVMLPSLASETDAALVAEKLRQALDRDFNINGRHIKLTASIGVALFPQHARSAEPLINCAARAVLQARKIGRNTVCFGLNAGKE
ncbi:GGDEF domain-containing protein [Uliginosibacterium sp. 31-16]|uniref:GGDEF domain-containing protein n=1 Tax=Uliginosibacterium sp. 31-16 TaxID=3068315 RepID=UPI00273D5208|nr:GGDEF domain-containing protein [Uliginosibacterium sp. 31-16]MDP5238066.1 GGDEF domain-containing protein [Uliginosibacterium sp. 31-16]